MLAAGSFSARTSYEMIARRIDESTAVKPACTATHANNTLTRLTCSTACISRMTTDQHCRGRGDQQQLATVDRVGDRATLESKTINGMKPANPMKPTSSDEPVIAYTCSGTATRVTCVPTSETAWPVNTAGAEPTRAVA